MSNKNSETKQTVNSQEPVKDEKIVDSGLLNKITALSSISLTKYIPKLISDRISTRNLIYVIFFLLFCLCIYYFYINQQTNSDPVELNQDPNPDNFNNVLNDLNNEIQQNNIQTTQTNNLQMQEEKEIEIASSDNENIEYNFDEDKPIENFSNLNQENTTNIQKNEKEQLNDNTQFEDFVKNNNLKSTELTTQELEVLEKQFN